MIHSNPENTQESLFGEASADASQDDERGQTVQENSLADPPEPSAEDPGHGKAPTRRENPETSHEAGQSLEHSGEATRREREVLDALTDAGRNGLTTWEFGQREGIEREGYSTRFSMLKQKGLIVVTGKRRRPDGTGRYSEIHVLAEYGEPIEEPKSNSPEDLGHAPPNPNAYGTPRPEPEPLPENFCRSAIQHSDARTFVDWIGEQELPVHVSVTVGGILTGLSGLGRSDLKWLCQAIRQAGRAPEPEKMRRAVMTHDVSVLREENGD